MEADSSITFPVISTEPSKSSQALPERSRMQEGVRVVYATDIPPVPRPQVTGYRVRICRCRSCSKQDRGRHPDVAPDQYGASAHRVGRRVMAAAHVLHYGVGVPVRKVPAVLRALTGVELSQGAISQDALRRARGAVGDAYHKLRSSVRARPLVHTDDTGWRVDGGPAFLMAFETDEATVYQVRARHRNEEVREVVQTKRGRGRSFGNRLSRLLREAMELRQAYHRGEAADFAAEAERLRREATYHLRDRPISDADNWRLQNELGWHHDRGNLLRFLDDPSIEPTNNRAERALRGAVIARKVSHCSKNVGGADAFSAFTSVIRTLARNGGDHSLVNGLCGVFSGAPVPTPSFLNPSSHSAPLINYSQSFRKAVSAPQVEVRLVESMVTFALDGTLIYGTPDMLYRLGDDTWTVTDWKTGQENVDLDQASFYALYVQELYGADPDNIRARIEWLASGNADEHRFSRDELLACRSRVLDSISSMREYLIDPAVNSPRQQSEFPLRDDTSMCVGCKFYELDEEEIATRASGPF